MRLLLDTHIFLWLNDAPEKCSASILQLCENSENHLFISYVSLWEMQIKQQLGKLELPVEEIMGLWIHQMDSAIVFTLWFLFLNWGLSFSIWERK